MRVDLSIHGIEKLGDLHNHLPSLAHHELFALQTRQMLALLERHSNFRSRTVREKIMLAL